MGYSIQAGAPQITINGRTFAVGAFIVMGMVFQIGVYEEIPAQGGWVSVGIVKNYSVVGDVLKDVQAKGGIVKFIQWVIAQINAIFAKLFGAPPAPTPDIEPSTDDEAKAAITAGVNALALTIVNGVPVLG